MNPAAFSLRITSAHVTTSIVNLTLGSVNERSELVSEIGWVRFPSAAAFKQEGKETRRSLVTTRSAAARSVLRVKRPAREPM